MVAQSLHKRRLREQTARTVSVRDRAHGRSTRRVQCFGTKTGRHSQNRLCKDEYSLNSLQAFRHRHA
eukprot:COSAG02_NODE_5351_length_4407_cov_4.772516_6_plen_66_part_01